MRILVNGKNGQLGRSIRKIINADTKIGNNQSPNDFIFVGREELNLSSESSISNYFDNNKFEVSAHEKFTVQMNIFKRFINGHLKNKTTRVLVIHGVGEGRLKSEILACLRGRRGYDMNDANYSVRGVGASYIDIKISIAEPL